MRQSTHIHLAVPVLPGDPAGLNFRPAIFVLLHVEVDYCDALLGFQVIFALIRQDVLPLKLAEMYDEFP